MFYDKDLGCRYEVGNCQFARDLVGPEVRCTACPFGSCVESLRATERALILKAPLLRQVYAKYDKGISATDIAASLEIPYNRVYEWVRGRERIERKLRTYAIV